MSAAHVCAMSAPERDPGCEGDTYSPPDLPAPVERGMGETRGVERCMRPKGGRKEMERRDA